MLLQLRLSGKNNNNIPKTRSNNFFLNSIAAQSLRGRNHRRLQVISLHIRKSINKGPIFRIIIQFFSPKIISQSILLKGSHLTVCLLLTHGTCILIPQGRPQRHFSHNNRVVLGQITNVLSPWGGDVDYFLDRWGTSPNGIQVQIQDDIAILWFREYTDKVTRQELEYKSVIKIIITHCCR